MNIDSQVPSLFLCDSHTLTEGHYHEFRFPLSELPAELLAQLSAVGPVDLIVTRHQGKPKAWFNVCPHLGRPLNVAPNRFLVDEHNQLICCVHGAVFEPNQGKCVSGPCLNAHLKAVAIEETEGKVSVRLS
ncbi:MAG TPA: Rieske 2Fe-2S domain-containing protein [Wenzhouxiangella sp.]